MKLPHILAAAGLMIATLGVGSAAEAQPHRGDRYQNGHHDDHRRGWNKHRRCRVEWRHHHRVRVCR